MRIALDVRFVTDTFPGIGRYAYNLARALALLRTSHELIYIHAPAVRNTRYDMAALLRLPGVMALAAPPALSIAGQAALPALLRLARADVYHAPYYLLPYAGLPCPAVVTLHDTIPHLFPGESSWRARLMFGLLSRLALHAAQGIITVSRRSRDDIVQLYGVPRVRVEVVYEAADEHFRPADPASVAALRARYRLPEIYVLCVASDKPHKNLATLLEAWDMLQNVNRCEPSASNARPSAFNLQRPTLILAGHRTRQSVVPETATIRDLGPVAEEDMAALFSGAALFVYPSRYEGFGLPPLEAMACGTPVICSRAGSLPEVADDAVLLVDPDDPGELAATIARVLEDSALQAALRAAGLMRAAQFSWRRTAEQTLAVYERVVL